MRDLLTVAIRAVPCALYHQCCCCSCVPLVRLRQQRIGMGRTFEVSRQGTRRAVVCFRRGRSSILQVFSLERGGAILFVPFGFFEMPSMVILTVQLFFFLYSTSSDSVHFSLRTWRLEREKIARAFFTSILKSLADHLRRNDIVNQGHCFRTDQLEAGWVMQASDEADNDREFCPDIAMTQLQM